MSKETRRRKQKQSKKPGKVAICSNCGNVIEEKEGAFKCPKCGSNVAVVLPYKMYLNIVESMEKKKQKKEKTQKE